MNHGTKNPAGTAESLTDQSGGLTSLSDEQIDAAAVRLVSVAVPNFHRVTDIIPMEVEGIVFLLDPHTTEQAALATGESVRGAIRNDGTPIVLTDKVQLIGEAIVRVHVGEDPEAVLDLLRARDLALIPREPARPDGEQSQMVDFLDPVTITQLGF